MPQLIPYQCLYSVLWLCLLLFKGRGDLFAEDIIDADTRPPLNLLLGPLLMLLPHVHNCSGGGAIDLVAVHALEFLGDLAGRTADLARLAIRELRSVLPHWLFLINDSQTLRLKLPMQLSIGRLDDGSGCRGHHSYWLLDAQGIIDTTWKVVLMHRNHHLLFLFTIEFFFSLPQCNELFDTFLDMHELL